MKRSGAIFQTTNCHFSFSSKGKSNIGHWVCCKFAKYTEVRIFGLMSLVWSCENEEWGNGRYQTRTCNYSYKTLFYLSQNKWPIKFPSCSSPAVARPAERQEEHSVPLIGIKRLVDPTGPNVPLWICNLCNLLDLTASLCLLSLKKVYYFNDNI